VLCVYKLVLGCRMTSLRWQSSLHPPSHRCHDNTEIGIETKNKSVVKHAHTITTPHSGLYGLIFGVTQPNAPFEESHIFNYNDKSAKVLLSSTPVRTKVGCLAEHCGCTFRAIFNSGDNVNTPLPSQTSTSVTLPFSSEPGNSDVSGVYGVTKVLTNRMSARIIHLPAQTSVCVQCVTFCGDGENVSSCIRNGGWEWGLMLHMRIETVDSDNHHSIKGLEDGTQNQDSLIAQQEFSDSKQNQTKPLVQKVDFNPPQARKKPLLCTICGRKFSTTISIRNHVISAHSSSLNKSSDLISPKLFRMPLTVLYENDEFVVVIKPQGMPVQGDKWTLSKSDLLVPFRADQIREGALSKPRVVHRLDSATGGCLVIAKTVQAESELKTCFANRSCKKRYRAIVFGRLKPNCLLSTDDIKNDDSVDEHVLRSGTINSVIDNKESITDYVVISYTASPHPRAAGWLTTVDLYPLTGRRHQLRKHMKLIGNPIWGDKRYGPGDKATDIYESTLQDRSTYKANYEYEDVSLQGDNEESSHINMCLWALEISIPRPCSKSSETVTVKIDEPSWFSKLRADQEQLASNK